MSEIKDVTAIKVLLKNSRGEYLIPYTEPMNNLDTHIDNVSNPHNVTKEQVGLGNVDNTSDLDKPISEIQKEYVENFQSPIITLSQDSGEISLETNKIYSLSVTDNIIFNLPITIDKTVFNQIKIMLKVANAPTIDFGTDCFFNLEKPEITDGFFDLYFDYDNNLDAWVAGALQKGNVTESENNE